MTVNRWQAADERRNELVVEFRRGKVIEMGPSVDDYDPERLRQIMERVVADDSEILRRLALGPGVEDIGQQITDEINADPEEVEQLRQARLSARRGDTVPLHEALADDDFFEEDEPVVDIQAVWDAAEKQLTEPPAAGAGWCAPSP